MLVKRLLSYESSVLRPGVADKPNNALFSYPPGIRIRLSIINLVFSAAALCASSNTISRQSFLILSNNSGLVS